MTTIVTSLNSNIPAGQAIPEWIHLVPAGTFYGEDGRGPYILPENVDELIRKSMMAGKLAIDENHATDLAAKEGRPAPARGWIVSLEKRDDGLWGRVEWTASGRALLEDHAYRGISPVIMSEKKTGRIVKVLRASLTNDPNFHLTHLHHSRSQDMDLIEKLRKALNLGADASEADVLAAATAASAAVTTHAASLKTIAEAAGLKSEAAVDDLVTHLQSRTADFKKLGDAAGIQGDVTVDALVTHLQAKSDKGDKGDEKTIISLQSQLDTLRNERAKEKATAAIDKAIEGGKPIKPLRDRYIDRHMKDPEGVQAELDALPSIHAGGSPATREPANKDEAALDDNDLHICELMGIDPKEYAKTKKLQVEKL
ncbi:phage protease [Microvirga terricola]|uniref:Mu-like prophage I protein n=1 Tax=Microvirga terricola TaxID=2719797 RepID=A0ABX0V734_9HYPH|nr:phage protease [Microvirga terricola]NIX75393.1 hypothetical protein [Microvirga terricola]